MKTNVKRIALAVALLAAPLAATVAAPAPHDPAEPAAKPASFSVSAFRTNSPLKVRVNVQNSDAQRLKVTLKNGNGEVMFLEYLSKKEAGRAFAFDLTGAEDGTYTVEVSNRREKVTRSFDVSTPQRAVSLL
jgi:hypothetical protein